MHALWIVIFTILMLDTVTTHLFSNIFSNSNLNTEYNAEYADYTENIESENYIRKEAIHHRTYTSFWNFVVITSVIVILMILFFIILPIFIRLYKRCRTTLRNYFYPTSELPFTIRNHITSIPRRQSNTNFLEVYRMPNMPTTEMV